MGIFATCLKKKVVEEKATMFLIRFVVFAKINDNGSQACPIKSARPTI